MFTLAPRQRWCDPGYCRRGLLQFWLAAAADVAVATRHTAGVLWSWALGPACVRQVSSVLAIGWWGASMAWHAACTWRLLFFRPSTAAASLPRLSTSFTGYHLFTSMRDGRGPVTELSADGARPSFNVPTPWREATSAVAEVWFGEHVVTTSFSTIGWRLLRQHFAAKVFVFHPRWKLYCTGLRALSQATLQEWGWPPAPMAPESCLQPLTSVGPGCGSVTIAQQQQQWNHFLASGASSRLLGWRTCSVPLNWFAVRVPCPSLRMVDTRLWAPRCCKTHARPCGTCPLPRLKAQ